MGLFLSKIDMPVEVYLYVPTCTLYDTLPIQIFQLLDSNKDNMINFRDFAWFLGVSCRADLPERLKLLYRLHLPPAYLDTDKDERDLLDESPKSDIADDAVEAADYFEDGER